MFLLNISYFTKVNSLGLHHHITANTDVSKNIAD